jgi:hypothetical protein
MVVSIRTKPVWMCALVLGLLIVDQWLVFCTSKLKVCRCVRCTVKLTTLLLKFYLVFLWRFACYNYYLIIWLKKGADWNQNDVCLQYLSLALLWEMLFSLFWKGMVISGWWIWPSFDKLAWICYLEFVIGGEFWMSWPELNLRVPLGPTAEHNTYFLWCCLKQRYLYPIFL